MPVSRGWHRGRDRVANYGASVSDGSPREPTEGETAASDTGPTDTGPADEAVADWPAQAADTVVRVVDAVREKTTEPAQTAARAIVYGLLAAFLVVVAVVLLMVGVFRALANYLPGEVWAAHAIVGAVFVITGLVLWTQRRGSSERSTAPDAS